MEVERLLSTAFVEAHPAEVAAILETAPAEDSAELLLGCSAESAAAVLERLDTLSAIRCLACWPAESAATIATTMPTDVASRLLRVMDVAARRRLLDSVDAQAREILERALSYPPGTVGAVMDPYAFTLPEEIKAGEAQSRIRSRSKHVRNYVYVVDRSQSLSGVLNLRDLMLAPAGRPLTEIMSRTVERLKAATPASAVADHPGLRKFRALPVVDQNGRLVGVLRSGALESAERVSVSATAGGPSAVGIGLAHLLWTLNTALLDPLFSAARTPRDRPGPKEG